MNNFIKKFIFLFILFNTLLCSAQVDLVSPKKGQIFTVNKPININWNNCACANSYEIQIATENTFITPIIDFTTTNNSYLVTLTTTGDYYIRLKSNRDKKWSGIINIKIININSVTGMTSWFSADSLVTSSGGAVSTWTDIKNNTRTASQPSSGYQPRLENVGLLNNKPGLTFTGSSPSFLELSPSISSSTFSLYLLRNIKKGDLTAQYVFGTSPGAGFYAEQNAANQGPGVFFFEGFINFYTIENVRDSNFRLYTHTPNSIFRNNKMVVSSSQNITNPNIFRIGGRLDGYYFTGTIAEFLYFNKQLDSVENIIVNQYFLEKYAPPVNLGMDTIAGSSFCDSITLTTKSDYLSYSWSNGKRTRSIKVTANNTYHVTAIGVLGDTTSDDLVVYPYRRMGNKTCVICQGGSVTVDLETKPSFNVLWYDNTTNKVKTFTNTGTYTVKITDNSGCFVWDTINVVVDVPKLSLTPIAGVVKMCEGEKLFVNSYSDFDSIRWSTGSNANFITVTTSGNYSIYARTINGCIINQTFTVSIEGKSPVANFIISKACQGNEVQFKDTSVTFGVGSNITSWKWNFSNGVTSTQQNAIDTFATSGINSASLKVTTNQGCFDSIYKTFTVNKNPVANFGNRKSCEGNPTTFEDLSIPNAANISNWIWDFAGLGIINDFQNPAFSFPAANTYNVKLSIINSNGCEDTTTNQVKVNQSPIANFSFDSVCGTSAVNFKFLATVPLSPTPPQPTIASWIWDFGDGTSEDSRKDVPHQYATTGTYPVKLSVLSSDQCPNAIEKQVKVFKYPIVDFDVSATQCAGKEIQFTDISQTQDGTPVTSWKWYFSGQSTATTQNASYTFTTEGNYTIQLTAANAVGCTGTKLRSVAVSGLPVPKFIFSPQNGLPPLIVNYTNQSPNTGNYIWDYGDNSGIFSGFNPPTHTYTTIGTYPIKLIATNFRGCTDTLTKFILVDKAFIDGVMTSITIIPNGDYYQIQAIILNASNIEIRDLGLNLQIGGGSVIRENWTGSLLPGQSATYNFTGQIKISENSIPVICASIDNVNNYASENKTDNNTYCKEVRVGNFDVLNIYPNPAYETINFGIMLPKDGKVTIGFIDMLGQTMYKKEFDGNRGYNNLSMSTMQLNAAIYVAVVTFDGETIRNKFMRRDRK